MNQPLPLLGLALGVSGGLLADATEPFLLLFTGSTAAGAFLGAAYSWYRREGIAGGLTYGTLVGGVFGIFLGIVDSLLES